MPQQTEPVLRDASELTVPEVHAIWTIRDAVFAVEQRCDAPDPDTLDITPGTQHVWLADEQGLTSYLRTYVDADGVRHVGRVCTRRDTRGQGLSGQLLRLVIDRWGHEPIVLGAQAHLEAWYGGFGFVVTGPHYDDAGIDHVPMTRPGRA